MTTDDLFKCETLQHAVLVKRHTRSQCHEPFGKDCADFLKLVHVSTLQLYGSIMARQTDAVASVASVEDWGSNETRVVQVH